MGDDMNRIDFTLSEAEAELARLLPLTTGHRLRVDWFEAAGDSAETTPGTRNEQR